MATIPEITGRLEAATEKAENASQIIYDVANGDASTEVPTASGPTPTLKKWFQDLGSSVEPMLAGIPARLDKAVLVYQTNPEAEAAAATLPDGQVVDVEDEKKRYKVQNGGLVFDRLLDDASVESYTPAGIGAVPTTVQKKLRESVSVEDFGAVGDGITDDTTAIQAALDFANISPYKTVRAEKNYKITRTLVLDRAKLVGSGVHPAYYKQATFIAGAAMNIMMTYTSDATIEDVYFDGNSLADWGVVGIWGTNRAHFNRVQVNHCLSFAFVTFGVQNSAYYDCTSYFTPYNFAFFNGTRNCSLYNSGGAATTSQILFDYDTSEKYGMSPRITDAGNDRINFFGGIYEYRSPAITARNTSGYNNDTGNFGFYGVEITGGAEGGIVDTTGCVTNGPTFNFYGGSFNWGTAESTPFSAGTLGRINFFGRTTFYGGANLPAKGITQKNSIADSIQIIDGTNWNTSGNKNPPNGFGLTAKYSGSDEDGLLAFFSNATDPKLETWYTDKSGRMCINGGSSQFRRTNSTPLFAPLTTGISDGTAYVPSGVGSYPNNGVTNVKWNFNYPGTTGSSAFSVYMTRGGGVNHYMYHGLASANATPHWALGFRNGSNYQEYLRCLYSGGHFTPGTDNSQTLGASSYRWSTIYAGTGTINTSDERDKQQVRDLSEKERLVATRLRRMIRAFKFNDSVAEKGDNARIHFGVIAQEVKTAFESEGLTAEEYAIFCYDEWEEEFKSVVGTREVTLESGEVITEQYDTGEKILVRPAGNKYGIRYEELLAFIISGM